MSGLDQITAPVNGNRTRTALSPVTLRLTPEERTKLEELAAGMTMSAYIRACVFGEETRRRKWRPKDVVADKRAAADALALLGQSRIANNLNQLAYHANIGSLDVGETETAQIKEAHACVLSIRSLLVKAPGASSASRQGVGPLPLASLDRGPRG